METFIHFSDSSKENGRGLIIHGFSSRKRIITHAVVIGCVPSARIKHLGEYEVTYQVTKVTDSKGNEI